MAVALTQVITEDRASGGQVIDGSLRFVHGNTQYLERTPGSAGNRRTFTWSAWIKRGELGAYHSLFCGAQDSSNLDYFFFWNDDRLALRDFNGTTYDVISTAKFRDPSAWYHIVLSVDTTQSTAANRVRFYVNSTELTDFDTSTYPAQNYDFHINNTDEQYVGYNRYNEHDGLMSQVYLVDGQQLAPSEFGFTDPLTNTWRPKKYTGTYGTNGFYLPMDGNSLIGEDKSGNGNDFTPVNFGGSNSIEKATGALPILNTVNGGNAAGVGVRTDTAPGNGPVGVSTYLVLAIPMVGIATDVSNKINGGSTEKIITSNGNVTGVSSSSNFYGGSFYFDGSGDYLSLSSSSDFALGTNDWTVEYFAYPTSTTQYQRHFYLEGSNANQIEGIFADSSGISFGKTNVWAPTQVSHPLNRWNHYALVHDSTNMRLYVNGTQVLTSTDNFADESKSLNIGYSNSTFGGYFTGYLQDFRIYKGVAKYTSEFIPASTDPDIVPDTPSGVAYGSALTKITDGAVYFDGTNDNLTIPAHSDLDLSSGNFTVEGFVYPTRIQEQAFVNNWNTQSTGQFQVQMSSSGFLQASWAPYSTSVYAVTGSTAMTANRWYHFAYTRSGSTFELFLDGISQGTQTSSNNASVNSDFILGENGSTLTRDLQGYLSNVRVLKGTALYTSNFTPPTEPLTNVTNTVLLCCQDKTAFVNGGQPILNTNSTGTTTTSGTRHDPYASSIVLALPMNGSNGGTTFTDQHATIKGSGSAKTVTVNGDAQTSTAQSKYYGSSGLFDGTGDYLTLSGSADFELTGEFTIEYFLYLTSNSGENPTISWGNGSFKTIFSDSNGDWKLEYPSTGVVLGGKEVLNTWVHYALTRDSSNNLRWFIDGKLQSLNSVSATVGSTDTLYIGRKDNSANHVNGYIQDFRIYDGAAKYTSDFKVTAPTVETPAAVTPGSITANGNAVATNFNPFTTDINAVRGQETSYPTLNPLFQQANVVLSNGNLNFATSANSSAKVGATIGLSTSQGGKYYWEVTQTGERRVAAGVMNVVGTGYSFANSSDIGLSPHEWGIRFSSTSAAAAAGSVSRCHNSEVLNFGNSDVLPGGVLQIALDLDNTSIWFGVNGSWMGGDPETNNRATYTNLTGEIVPFVQRQTGTGGCIINFGQKPFKYAPPEGFKPITLTNLPRPTEAAVRPDKYFDTILFDGNGTSQSITGLGFKPDFVWIKDRSSDSNFSHRLVDSVRGSTRVLFTDSTNGNANEQVDSYGTVDKFTDNGFDLRQGTNVASGDGSNTSGSQMVAWCWKAGGDAGTFNVDGVDVGSAAAAGLSGKNITPTACSIGTKQGFSIIRYTGNGNNNQTVPHGLSQAPTLIMTKSLDQTGTPTVSWGIFHKDGSFNNKMMYFTLNAAQAADTNVYTTTSQTDEHFTIGTWTGINQSGTDYISYIWHDVPGLFKTGLYTGNGSSNGPLIADIGFSPNLIFLKRATGGTGNWVMLDSKRPGYNPEHATLCANLADDENASGGTTNDFLSNGLKIRGSTDRNASGNDHIYFAWAKAPSFNLYGAQANAR